MNALAPSQAHGINNPIIKVCGLTRSEDAEHALGAGANMLGFVVAPKSPRGISIEQVADLVRGLPASISTVLVTVNESPEQLAQMAAQAAVSHVQLCGHERAMDFQGFPLPILKKISVGQSARLEIRDWIEIAEAFVLDHPSAPGGTGQLVDLSLAGELAAEFPCLLAGGLSGANVVEASKTVRPIGVDASSKLEANPGIKNHEAVELFVQNARAALESSP